jgi:phage terminase large subunit GpA-like protein
VLLLGHGEGGEEWIIDYIEIDGDPTRPDEWKRLDAYLTEPIVNAHGVPMRVSAACVDAGYLQDDVLAYTRTRETRGIHGIKGASTPGKPIMGRPTKVDLNWRGSTVRNGAKLWLVGEDTAKTRLLHILTQDRKAIAPSDRRLHFSEGLDESFFSMFAAEVWDPNKRRWVKVRQRNEALDCYCYASAAAHHPRLRIPRWGPAQWQRQRELMEPAVSDLFSQPSRTEVERKDYEIGRDQAKPKPPQPQPRPRLIR